MIGTALKKVRAIFDYSASEMSDMIGISRSYLSEIENNIKEPSLKILERYSEITGIKLSSLMLLAEQYEGDERRSCQATTAKILNALIEKMAGASSNEKL